MIDYQDVIKKFSGWASHFQENNDRAINSTEFVYINSRQWNPATRSSRAAKKEESLVFNFLERFTADLKATLSSLKLDLQVVKTNPKSGVSLKDAKDILTEIILRHDNEIVLRDLLMSCFQNGYGACLLSAKNVRPDSPSLQPQLYFIENLKSCFWDPKDNSLGKKEGRYCGVVYKKPKEFFTKLKDDPSCEDEVEVLDYWYREPYDETFLYTREYGWKKREDLDEKDQKNAEFKRILKNYKTMFCRFVNKKIYEKPSMYFGMRTLPLLYWKGDEVVVDGEIVTRPFCYKLKDAQTLVNYSVSTLINEMKRCKAKTQYIVTPQLIKGQERYWENIETRSGAVIMNDTTSTNPDGMKQPMVIPGQGINPTTLQSVQTSIELLRNLSGLDLPTARGEQPINSKAALNRQLQEKSNLFSQTIHQHLENINALGASFMEMIPNVIFEEREIGPGIFVNKLYGLELVNDLKEITQNSELKIQYGPTTEIQKEMNVNVISGLMSTNQQLSPLLIKPLIENLDLPNKESLLRQIDAMNDPSLEKVGNGEMTVEQYQQLKQQQSQQAPPSPEQEQLAILKEKNQIQAAKDQGTLQLKQQELAMKQQKMDQQAQKDAANLEIKQANTILKGQKENANTKV